MKELVNIKYIQHQQVGITVKEYNTGSKYESMYVLFELPQYKNSRPVGYSADGFENMEVASKAAIEFIDNYRTEHNMTESI